MQKLSTFNTWQEHTNYLCLLLNLKFNACQLKTVLHVDIPYRQKVDREGKVGQLKVLSHTVLSSSPMSRSGRYEDPPYWATQPHALTISSYVYCMPLCPHPPQKGDNGWKK